MQSRRYATMSGRSISFEKIVRINKVRERLEKFTERSLVVFDVDDVLITPVDKLLQPCAKRLNPNPLDKIEKLEELKRKHYLSLMYSQTKMLLVEPQMVDVVNKLKLKKVKFIALTAFETPSYGIIKDTALQRIHELRKFGFDFSGSFSEYGSFHLREGFSSQCPLFKEGILFSAPHAKGKVLDAFLKKIAFDPSDMMVFEDSEENLDSIISEVKTKASIQCIHYLGALKISRKADPEVGDFQVQHLLKTRVWLNDHSAKIMLSAKKLPSSKMNNYPSMNESPPLSKSGALVFDYITGAKSGLTPTVVTPYHWPDMDGIACTYALVQLLKRFGYGNVRGAISETPQKEPLWIMKKFGFGFPQIKTTDRDQIFLVDVSDPKDLPTSLPLDQVKVIIDHRKYTDLPSMPNAVSWIETVGSAATLVYQIYQHCSMIPDTKSAVLLYAAIMSNTICLKTRNTTLKDVQAAEELKLISKVGEEFIQEMFADKSNLDGVSLHKHLDEDLSTKLQMVDGEPTAVAQLEIVNTEKILQDRMVEFLEALRALQKERKAAEIFLVAPDLLSGHTYFVFLDSKMEKLVVNRFKLEPRNGYWTTNQTLTRKDVLHTLMENQ